MTDDAFRKLDESVVHRGYAFDTTVARYESPGGEEFTRDVVRHVGAVAVLPRHDDGTITVVRQYRAPIEAELIEIPAGLRDVDDEPPDQTAVRELAEEVGLVADRIEPMCHFHTAAGFSDEVVHIFEATGLRSVDNDRQGPEEEHMTVERHPLADLVDMVADGRITDAKTIIAVLMAARSS